LVGGLLGRTRADTYIEEMGMPVGPPRGFSRTKHDIPRNESRVEEEIVLLQSRRAA
jgi:hypothetical protein